MFEKYPDQARERRQWFWTGLGFAVIGMLVVYLQPGGLTFFILLMGLVFIAVAIFTSHLGFETAKRIGTFFIGF